MAKPMVVGVDGTAASLCALSAAAELAEESGAGLVVVHVRHESGVVAANSALAGAGVAINEALDEVEQMSRERVADVLARRRVKWRFAAAPGDPAPEVIEAAPHAQPTTIGVAGPTPPVAGARVARPPAPMTPP